MQIEHLYSLANKKSNIILGTQTRPPPLFLKNNKERKY
jgi:hypothetical protein